MRSKRTVRDVMTQTLAYCTESTKVRDIAQMMVNHDCGEIPVLDEEGAPIGIITDRDICCRVVAPGRDSAGLTAADCMSCPCVTIREDAPIDECCQLLQDHQIGRVLVVDAAGLCCGIVTQADLATALDEKRAASVVRAVSRPIPSGLGDRMSGLTLRRVRKL
jgi:CBS domain-containing protein